MDFSRATCPIGGVDHLWAGPDHPADGKGLWHLGNHAPDQNRQDESLAAGRSGP
jgi:hypothetical protein